jgi:Tfp pilus assembly protein PilF
LRSLHGWLFVWLIASVFIPKALRGQTPPKPTFAMQINVQARLPDGSPAPQGSLCELELQNTQPLEHSQVDSSGKCHFVPTDHVIYIIRVKAPGYMEAATPVDLQNAQTGMAFLVLKPIPGQGPPTPPKSANGDTVSAVDLSAPAESRKEFDLGQRSIENHDLDGGIAHLKKAIKLHDQYPRAYMLLGMAYNEQKKWKEAQGALERAVQLDPKAIEAYFQLGAALNQLKDFAGAQKALSEGLQIDPNGATASTAHYELARAYMGQGKWQDAEPHASKAIAAQPDFAAGHVLMGNILLKKGDGPGALHEFQEYLRLDPAGPMAAQVKEFIPKLQAAMQKK